MKRIYQYADMQFKIGNYTPRRNEYERGLKYEVFIMGDDSVYRGTGYRFSTMHEAKAALKKIAVLYM